jgi:hypothetical protein
MQYRNGQNKKTLHTVSYYIHVLYEDSFDKEILKLKSRKAHIFLKHEQLQLPISYPWGRKKAHDLGTNLILNHIVIYIRLQYL